MEPLEIDEYISRLVSVSKLDAKVENLAIKMANTPNNHLLANGKSLNGLAVAYIYLTAILLGVNLLQIDLSRSAGVTEVTIRNRCNDILTSFKLTIKVQPM
jgi:transcription initiation factor TFIIB